MNDKTIINEGLARGKIKFPEQSNVIAFPWSYSCHAALCHILVTAVARETRRGRMSEVDAAGVARWAAKVDAGRVRREVERYLPVSPTS